MAYELLIDDMKIWRKDCSKIPPKHFRQILLKVRELEKEPWPENVNVKELVDYTLADFRLRSGDYRVLFDRNEELKQIKLLRVLNRSKLY